MRNLALTAAAALALTLPVSAQDATPQEAEAPPPSPNEIVNSAAAEEWIVIPAEDLLVMTLAPDAQGQERQVILQLMPAPFSQGWVENIRTLARAKWYDGISVNRVQDNYVVQWGDPGYDNPESGEVEQKPLPEGLNVMGEVDYFAVNHRVRDLGGIVAWGSFLRIGGSPDAPQPPPALDKQWDVYGARAGYSQGWPAAFSNVLSIPNMTISISQEDAETLRQPRDANIIGRHSGAEEERESAARSNRQSWATWPVHCYAMVGVGRNYSPDTGTGAELYTVIGHAPRHLDRNIALVGRIISGMEHLSSLPRGSGVLGFYTEEEADRRTPILSIRVAADLPEDERPLFEYLSTEGETFARYAEARANRRDPFFIVPAGGADICNIPVPIRAFEYVE